MRLWVFGVGPRTDPKILCFSVSYPEMVPRISVAAVMCQLDVTFPSNNHGTTIEPQFPFHVLFSFFIWFSRIGD